MFGVESGGAFHAPVRSHGAASVNRAGAATRRLALLANGLRYGPITRLITPWNVGELTTPFVFLDYGEATPESQPLCGVQPRSGIAGLTLVLEGRVSFEDAAGHHGEVCAGGVAWMNGARGIWRGGGSAASVPLRAFQLWISLPPSQPGVPVSRETVAPQDVAEEGPARVILGRFGRVRSSIRGAPLDINLLHVRLRDGQRWRYVAPTGHDVTWLAVDRGGLKLQEGERVYWEQVGVFGDSGAVFDVQADGGTSFVVGSARRQIGPLSPGEHPLAASDAPLVEAEPVSVRPFAQGSADGSCADHSLF